MKETTDELQRKATDLIESIRLRQRLGDFDFYFTGSYVLDAMAWPDLDVNVRFGGRHDEVFALGSEVLRDLSPSWFELRHTANEENSPGIYFLGFETTYQSLLWNVDIWFLDDEIFAENQDWLKATCDAMTPELRDSIVAIKRSLLARGDDPTKHSSMDVYAAVLSEGVCDIQAFDAWGAKH